jgi:hypothetical protein
MRRAPTRAGLRLRDFQKAEVQHAAKKTLAKGAIRNRSRQAAGSTST